MARVGEHWRDKEISSSRSSRDLVMSAASAAIITAVALIVIASHSGGSNEHNTPLNTVQLCEHVSDAAMPLVYIAVSMDLEKTEN